MESAGHDAEEVLVTASSNHKNKPESQSPEPKNSKLSRERGRSRRAWQQRGGGWNARNRQERGRSSYTLDSGDRRERNETTKRRRLDKGSNALPVYATEFSKEEVENEIRRPKRKVAVLFGYAGSGYKGLQLSDKEKTIEGELFQAFVAAGAVSKANADDPKKTSLVRCARTDKGVHAAGNVLSMKLIVEDDDIIQKINNELPPQIRVWDAVRVNSSFSAYLLCDSRIYEYLIPTHCFVPPHPKSFLGRQLIDIARDTGDFLNYSERQKDVASFWDDAEDLYIKPLLRGTDTEVGEEALRLIFEGGQRELKAEAGKRKQTLIEASVEASHEENNVIPATSDASMFPVNFQEMALPDEIARVENHEHTQRIFTPLEVMIRKLKNAYQAAKYAYRISPDRLLRIQSCLSCFVGTHNYHNYTVQKAYNDPSAKRVMHSFIAAADPITINNVEWLSLKVHGQSFMMHQIRKMISMCALMVRCGTAEEQIKQSFEQNKYSIPKAPGLGLLLERPIFEGYNQKLKDRGGIERGPLGFTKYNEEMHAFKQKQIYERIFQEEAEGNLFHNLFSGFDSLRSSELLFLSSAGYRATQNQVIGSVNLVKNVETTVDSENENPETAGDG